MLLGIPAACASALKLLAYLFLCARRSFP